MDRIDRVIHRYAIERTIRACLDLDPTPAETAQRLMDALRDQHALHFDANAPLWIALLVRKWHDKTPDLDAQAEAITARILSAASL